jgi:hypothetical protein
VKSAEPGEIVDLTEKIVDYGYDPEAAAGDFMCGLEYVSDFERAKKRFRNGSRRESFATRARPKRPLPFLGLGSTPRKGKRPSGSARKP